MFDTNVLLDVFQERQPHYDASARCMSLVVEGTHDGCIAGHTVTTLFYLLQKYADTKTARDSTKWLLSTFEVAPTNADLLTASLDADERDFEDAVIAESARRANCSYVVTRNVTDFAKSDVPAISPAGFLARQQEPS